MQPGYPGSGQDPYGQQQPYVDPYAQPQYQPQQPQQPQPEQQGAQPPAGDPYGQPPQAPQYQDPYAQPTSGSPYPPAAPYAMGGYGAPMGAPPQQNNTQGLVAMILGIVSIPMAVCCSIVGIPMGIAAIVLGILGIKKADAGQASNRGQALAGAICGGAGILVAIVWFIAVFALNLNTFPTAP
ncbi:hypothetical protein HC028_10060 [Planosporangium flavigriseum]|uniref:DUF4190 domain-containing protein n=1 Tax=Planosporangium flavigriseum TaxID=373681 RepID=A0A8J3LT23_9ACTN|nr:DUF4190 domain-containing protein [Planosporangium flavigriseum]NJC64843.1 hypothetical protein [Planosporangium flavigriseum]GIG72715.1 hypothetical protein Pfl04_11190 [Planosporangium flavigriseum]